MNDYIVKLNNIKILAAHGLHDSEKATKQLFEVDIAITSTKETCNDDIGSSIDYEYIYNLIVRVFEENCFNLIETLGEKIIDSICASFSTRKISVTIRKPEISFDNNSSCVEVSVIRSNE
tara:strand:+ start:96 stop:455 length:360 start_codon:yes stop_codon:yes gene_type:complete